jgi:hypothetical protein
MAPAFVLTQRILLTDVNSALQRFRSTCCPQDLIAAA